jgi:hypothetical protein
MGANNVHGANLPKGAAGAALFPKFASELPRGCFENGAVGCYKPTVNESETITEAQPFWLARSRSDANQLRTSGFRYPVAPYVGRS